MQGWLEHTLLQPLSIHLSNIPHAHAHTHPTGATAGPDFPVVVSTYEIVMADIKALARYNWKYIVVDEGHRLKNFECKLIRDLKTLPADNKLLLTGNKAAGLH